jgi:hypothetical protein
MQQAVKRFKFLLSPFILMKNLHKRAELHVSLTCRNIRSLIVMYCILFIGCTIITFQNHCIRQLQDPNLQKIIYRWDRLCVLVVRVSGYRSRDPGFDSRRYQIFWVVDLERGPLSLVSTIEELFGRNSSGSSLGNREYHRGDPLRWPLDILYPKKSTLTSPTSGDCSVCIVLLRTKVTEFSLKKYSSEKWRLMHRMELQTAIWHFRSLWVWGLKTHSLYKCKM